MVNEAMGNGQWAIVNRQSSSVKRQASSVKRQASSVRKWVRKLLSIMKIKTGSSAVAPLREMPMGDVE
jgi:hypothetical protein